MLYRILAVLALFFLSACGSTPEEAPAPIRKPANQTAPGGLPPTGAVLAPITPAEPAGRAVKIALLVPLTGESSSVGNALLDAATLALMDKYGTDASGQAVKVVLVPKDTQGTPAGAAKAAQEVLAAGAQLIVGPLFSGNVPAVAEVARQYKVNVLTFSNNPEVAGDNVFVFGFLVDQQVQRILNYALNRNLTRIALLSPNDAYGLSVQKSAKKVLSGSDLALAGEAYYNPLSAPTTEIDTIVARHTESPLSAVLLPISGQNLQATVRGLAAKGVTQPGVKLLGTGSWDEDAVLRSGVLTGGWFASASPERFSSYQRRFNENFGYSPPRVSSLAYDALALASALVGQSADGRVTAAQLTDPAGFNGPVNGIFRCKTNGICERGLAVLEVTSTGAKVIDAAPKSF